MGITVRGAASDDVLVRVRRDGTWGSWTELHLDSEHGPDRGTPEAAAVAAGYTSDPIWVDRSDGYEISVPGEVDVVVHLVRDRSRRVLVDGTAQASADQPGIELRDAWGARPPKEAPFIAGDFRLALVHHSVTRNDYAPADVPSIIRGIQAYHMDARGWNDIAYNFVVDRFGRVWEGRAGGITQAVVGGHAAGFNTYSTGVVLLGDFSSVAPPDAALAALSNLLAWKFAVHRLNPNGWSDYTTAGSTSLPAGTYRLPRIIGHRDVGQTSCPGAQLYNRLGSIRSAVTSKFGPEIARAPAIPITGDFDGDGSSDTLFYRQGSSPDEIWYGLLTGGFTRVPIAINGVYRPVAADFNGDGITDILWHGPGSDLDSVMYGRLGRGFTKRDLDIPSSHVPFAADFNGDGPDDLFWYGPGLAPDKLYYGTTSSGFLGKAVDVATTYTPVVGDFNGDGRSDILWYTPNSGPDRYWYGRSELGQWGRPASPSIGEAYMPVVGDYDANGMDDIFWFGHGTELDSVWWGAQTEGALISERVYATTVGAPKSLDVAGDGADDMLWYAPGRPGDPYWRFAPGGIVIGRHTLMINGSYLQASGDYNGDGREDLLWWTAGGQSHVWYGRLDGDFTRIQVA